MPEIVGIRRQDRCRCLASSDDHVRIHDVASADRDMPSLARLISLAFGTPLEGVQTWLDNAGVHEVRVLREGAARARNEAGQLVARAKLASGLN